MFRVTILLALVASLATSRPTSDLTSDTNLQARAETHILAPTVVGLHVCTDANWKGICDTLFNGPGLCVPFNSTFAKKVSAVGPNADISGCDLFENENCSGMHLSGVKKPGEANLALAPQGGKFNDFFSSYICY